MYTVLSHQNGHVLHAEFSKLPFFFEWLVMAKIWKFYITATACFVL